MPPFRRVLPPAPVLAAADELAATATSLYAPGALARGGPYQRALNLTARGVPVPEAAATAAKQGKGHVAELAQSAGYSARAGALFKGVHARPNPRANDPRDDVQLRRRRRRVGGAQLKVGTPAYVLRAAERGNYDRLVVNTESLTVLEESGYDIDAEDRLVFRGNEAATLSAETSEQQATEALARAIRDEPPVGIVDLVVSMARAGSVGALHAASTTVLVDLVDAWLNKKSFDAGTAIRTAMSAAGRAAARGSIQVTLLVTDFMKQARDEFSDRVLHRIARSAVTSGAIAEVLVETAIDLVAVLRGSMTFEDLLRRFGVHAFCATGGALGLALGAAISKDAPWWAQGLSMLVFGTAGAYGGRRLGAAIFAPTPDPQPDPTAPWLGGSFASPGASAR